MFLRPTVTETLADVANQVNTRGVSWGGSTLGIRPHLTGEAPTFELDNPTGANVEIPATPEGITQLAEFAGIPTKFALRTKQEDPELAEIMFARLFRSNPDNVAVQYVPDEGIEAVYKPSQNRIEPRALVERLTRVMDPASPVIEWWNEPDEFRIDTVVDYGAGFGIGGEYEVVDGRKVGDITAGGVRLTLGDRSKNHAPSVQPYLYRLACTNGMENVDPGLRIDARGATVEQVLAEVERMAEAAFAQVEAQISAFYELRNQPITGDVTQAVLRIAEERGLPQRTALELMDRVPEITDESGNTTQFEVINLITNAANNGRIVGRRPVRRTLERVGGALITEHAARCGHCQQRLN